MFPAVAGRSSPRAGSHRAAEPRAPARPGSAVMGVSPLPARPQRLGAGRPQFRVSPRPPSASLSIPSLPFPSSPSPSLPALPLLCLPPLSLLSLATARRAGSRSPSLPACLSNSLALSLFQAPARRSRAAEGGPEPPARLAPGCPGKRRNSPREAQLAAGAQRSAVLSLPGPRPPAAVEVSPHGSGGPAGSVLPACRRHKGQNGPVLSAERRPQA